MFLRTQSLRQNILHLTENQEFIIVLTRAKPHPNLFEYHTPIYVQVTKIIPAFLFLRLKFYVLPTSPVRTTLHAHLILLHLINLINGKQCKSVHFTVQFSQASCYSPLLRSIHPLHNPVLQHLQCLLHVSLLTPKILKQLLDFLKICAPFPSMYLPQGGKKYEQMPFQPI